MKKYISKSYGDTVKIAKEFINVVENGDIVLLQGDLGAGKTAFVKAFVNALGGDENIVTSPTFTLVNEYVVDAKTIYHFDLYRIEREDELYNIGIEEYLYSNAICFIEWPERAKELLSDNLTKIVIKKINDNTREIQIIKKD